MNKLINALYVFGFQAIGFQLAISDCKVFDFKIRNECCFFFISDVAYLDIICFIDELCSKYTNIFLKIHVYVR